MIDVKSSEHIIGIVTGKIGLESDICQDVMNVLIFIDRGFSCRPLFGRGISIIYSDKKFSDSLTIVKTLLQHSIKGFWIIPIDVVCRASYEDIAHCSLELILTKRIDRYPPKILGKCRKRGNYIDSCSSLLRYVGNYIEMIGIGEVDFKRYEYILRIEIIDNIAGISIYRRDLESLFRIKSI